MKKVEKKIKPLDDREKIASAQDKRVMALEIKPQMN